MDKLKKFHARIDCKTACLTPDTDDYIIYQAWSNMTSTTEMKVITLTNVAVLALLSKTQGYGSAIVLQYNLYGAVYGFRPSQEYYNKVPILLGQ